MIKEEIQENSHSWLQIKQLHINRGWIGVLLELHVSSIVK